MRTGETTWLFVGGAGLGAGLMLLLDPISGRRRRSRVVEKGARAAHELTGGAVKASHDVTHRTRGVMARAASIFRRAPVPDAVLEERVRARLGRLCSHPRAIEVQCRDGIVELAGPILRRERRRVVSGVRRVRGVHGIRDERLEAHEQAGDIPALQGPGIRREATPELLQQHWSPAIRLAAGGVGVGLLAVAARRGSWAWTGGTVGAALITRALLNQPWKRIVGVGAGHRAVDVRKTINVESPVDEVFAFWRALETFPRFMTHVREVSRTADNRYHWKVEGPGGTSFEWDAEVTREVPNEVIAWRSVPGSSVESAGIVRFEPTRTGGTRVTIQLSYNPPGGVLGHGIATLLGASPRKQMNDDLLRFKSLIEQGRATGREKKVSRDEIEANRGSPQVH